MQHRPIRVLCVDDNELIAEAIQRRLRREPDFEWLGWLPRSSALARKAAECLPDVVILDVDIPGDDSFESIRAVACTCPNARVIMLSGHASRDYLDMAVAAGAWGYMLKSDGSDTIVEGLRQVAQGKFFLDPGTLIELKR